MTLSIILTVLPSFLIAIYLIFSDRFKEPPLNIVYAFVLGFLIIIPAGYLNYYFIFSRENAHDLVFIADNPGLWLFHCHMLEHHAAGMGGVISIS